MIPNDTFDIQNGRRCDLELSRGTSSVNMMGIYDYFLFRIISPNAIYGWLEPSK